MSWVTFQVSGVRFQVLGVRCQVSRVTYICIYFFDKAVELVGEGLLSMGPTTSSSVKLPSDHEDTI